LASVLVIAADPTIESLIGELVSFAGHRAMFDVTGGAAGESIRRVRPDVAMIDTSLPPSVVDACLGASEEVHSQPVLVSSTDSTGELAAEALADNCLYFPLPGGPKPLRALLDRAIAASAGRALDFSPVAPERSVGQTAQSLDGADCFR
jgi:DNA-binding NtrC family response regulator